MSRLSNLRRALQRFGEPEQPRAERWPATGLSALYGIDSATKPAGIKDVSATGVYLLTDERFPANQTVALILRLDSEQADNSELQISIKTRAAWQGEDGVALEFVLPPGMNPDLCAALVHDIVSLTDRDQVVDVFRHLRTVLFLYRLCESGADEAIQLLDGRLDTDRTATLFKIAFAVENLLAAKPDASRMRAHPKLLASILREGSWAPDEVTLKLWVGLLASSCSVDAPDDSNQIFVDILVHITPTEAKILIPSCERALSSMPGLENSASAPIVLSTQEMVHLTGVHDLGRNATDLAYLFNLGLVENLFDFTSYRDIESFDTTPSRLGLELYNHCHGHSEKIDPKLDVAAREHLAVFFPPPIPSAFENFMPTAPDPRPEK
ncbi:MAG: hypothetical protein ACLP07_06905 [Terracidiphilus sp.]